MSGLPGCGNKGALYLPQAAPPEPPPAVGADRLPIPGKSSPGNSSPAAPPAPQPAPQN